MSSKKVIFYLIDGARPDILKKLVSEGQLPNIEKYLINQGSFVTGTTCFPSTTGPAYLPFLTGQFPGAHHITGIRWFDKAEYFKRNRWARNAMRSYCGYEAKYFNDDMHPEMPSLFELYDQSYNIYNMVTKGVSDENDLTKEGKSKLYFDAHFKHHHHVVDEKGHLKLMEALDKDFKFVFAVFPSIDWDSHTYHFEDSKTIEAYRLVDRSLGEVVQRLQNQKTYDDTLIVMASDHGLTSTHSHLDLGKFFRSHKYRVLEYPSIWSLLPEVAVFISGNSFATLSFLDQQELYFKNKLFDRHGLALEKLVNHEAIDFIVTRKNAHSLSVINSGGEAEIIIQDDKLAYKAITGNPFKIPDTHGYLNDKQAFDFCYNSDYPDALIQCKQLFESHRSGDVVVSANVGYDLRDFWEIPEHKGSHGSLHKDHLHVPLLFSKKLVDTPIRTTEVFHIIREYLDQAK